MKLYKVVVPAAALIFAGQVFTASAAEDDGFVALDADADGYISSEEAKSHQTLTEKWGDVDINRDGMIDRAEFSALEITETPKAE